VRPARGQSPPPSRPDIAQDLPCFPVGKYLILDRLLPDGIDVVRVVHGARRLDSQVM
jgi:toxin ParE1/3/4